MSRSGADIVAGRTREAWLYMWDRLRPMPDKQLRAVIFGQGRTGSALLESLICSTGHFEANGELLNIDRNGQIMNPLHFVQGLAKWKADKNFIFHLKIYQLTRDRKRPLEPRPFLDALCDQGWRVIYLKRENIVKHALSNLVAEQRKAYHKFDDRPEQTQVHVDCARFVELVEERIRFGDEERATLDGIDHHVVVYDRDLMNADMHQRTVDGILDYLQLERRQAITSHRKVNTTSMADLITNYDEFAACVAENGWEAFLD